VPGAGAGEIAEDFIAAQVGMTDKAPHLGFRIHAVQRMAE
jgi:hypothetical protein